MYEMIYYTQILGYYEGIPIVGNSWEGYTIWEVDYAHKIAYLTR